MSEPRYGVLTADASFVQMPRNRRRGPAMIETTFRAGTLLLVEERWDGFYCIPLHEPAWDALFLRHNWYGGKTVGLADVPVRWLSPLEELALEGL